MYMNETASVFSTTQYHYFCVTNVQITETLLYKFKVQI